MSLNIVELIENTPITKLDGSFQSKLIEKVKDNFSSYEQQLFLSSFYCYLKYDSQNNFVIDLDNVWKWVGFGQKIKAKELLEKHFTIDIDYKCSDNNLAEQKMHGGHNKQIFMLTVDTFKRFCMKAGTKKANEIHDYFIKIEKITHQLIKEEEDKKLIEQLKQQLLDLETSKNTEIQQIEEKTKQEYAQKLEKEKALEKEKMLLTEFSQNTSIVYVIKVKTFENKHYIIKIGESRRGIQGRYTEHKSKYEECLLLDCFAVQKSKDFENFLHNHEQIRANRVSDLKGHETEHELFLIGKNLSYQTLLGVINNNIKYFNSQDTTKLEMEIEQLKLMLEMKDTNNHNPIIQELTQTVKQLSSKIDSLENTIQELVKQNNTSEIKTTNGFKEPLATVGPRLQKVHPETLTLVKTYESVSEAMKENSHLKRPSINKAVLENTIYHGFRWIFVDRELDPTKIHHIESTKQTRPQNNGYIAKLNKEKTEILNVYLDRKTAAQLNGYESSSALDVPVKKFALIKNHYYKLYHECDEDLVELFETQKGKPCLYKNGVGQYDSENNLIKEFACKYDCIKELSISDKTLSKALLKNIPYNGFYYKELGMKLFV
jgi:phage anti-repressor protein